MKIASKIVKLILLLIIILVVIVGAGFYFFGEHFLKIGVETAATKALGVGVEIKDVDLSVLKGGVEIEGLKVKNPAGYTYNTPRKSDQHIRCKLCYNFVGNVV